MKKIRVAFISTSIAAATLFSAAPASANDDLQWSVTVGSADYLPPVVHRSPRVVYEHVQPVVAERRIIVRDGYSGHPHDYRGGRRHGHYREHDRHHRDHH